MAFEDIIKKIAENAEQERDRLLREAMLEADSVRQAGGLDARVLSEDLERRSRERADRERERILTLTRLECRKKLLAAKQACLDKVFDKVRQRFTEMPPEQYREILKGILRNAQPDGDEELVPATSQRDLYTSEFMNELNASLGNPPGHITLSEESRDMLGGFVLSKGRHEDDCSLESLMARLREELEPETANILFSE